jgi:hypothetical protein
MKTELVSVTPSLARDWLKKNTKNRAIRPSHVETLRQSFERGEQVTTHQGIAFDIDGILLDGQHRLSAIGLMHEGFSFTMMVTWGLDRNKVFHVVDATQSKRSTADVLSVDRHVAETANFLARIYKGDHRFTPTYVVPFVEFVQPEVTDLIAFCGSSVRTWSSAPVRAAAVLCMKFGNANYTKLTYSTLVLRNFDAMPRAAQAVFKAHMAGTVRAAAAYDIFARCLKVFDPQNADLTKIQISDVHEVVARARALLDEAIFEPTKKLAPPLERESKGMVLGRHSASRRPAATLISAASRRV